MTTDRKISPGLTVEYKDNQMAENLRTIKIDLEVHKRIENERMSFEEKPSDVLRRLLCTKTQETTEERQANESPWTKGGVALSHGTQLKMSYNGISHEGWVLDGEWFVEGALFDNPSAAANWVTRRGDGKKNVLNGWTYWWVRSPMNLDWVRLRDLRSAPRVRESSSKYSGCNR